MRDLERKVNKFIKNSTQSAKKVRATSPTMTFSMCSPTTASTAPMTQSATKVVKKANNRTFSMTVTFTPQVDPRFLNKKSKDISIHHQENKQKMITAKPVEYARSPRRNPITQDGEEPCYEFKSCAKQTPLSNKMTFFDEESPVKKRADGEYKISTYRSEVSPPPPCIKTFPRAMIENDEPEEQRRIRKGAAMSLKNLFNPIVGDNESASYRRVRKAALSPGPSEETKKLNDKKGLLATDIGYSPKGRVYRDSSLADYAQSLEDPAPTKGRRYASPQFEKKVPEMKGLLQYSYSGIFKAENVSPKVSATSYREVVKSLNSSQIF